jgi:hypothetical protein
MLTALTALVALSLATIAPVAASASTSASAPASALASASTPAPAKAGGTSTVTTAAGLRVTVTPVRRLDPTGATVKVTGRGFNPTIGIYVALCVKPKKGRVPTPCGGGINTSGKKAASVWVSSNPPAYGQALATPFGKGGSFSVKLSVSALIGKTDCRKVACAIVTRADHTQPDERRSDVIVPVTFAP